MMSDSGIATIFIKNKKYFCQILFDEHTVPINLFACGTKEQIETSLNIQYPNIQTVTSQEFLCELDHINLFHSRSTAQMGHSIY